MLATQIRDLQLAAAVKNPARANDIRSLCIASQLSPDLPAIIAELAAAEDAAGAYGVRQAIGNRLMALSGEDVEHYHALLDAIGAEED